MVATDDVAVEDLQLGLGVGGRPLGEDEVAVGEPGVGLPPLAAHVDEPEEDGAGVIGDGTVVMHVAAAPFGQVLLPGAVVEVLLAVAEIQPEHVGLGSRARQVGLEAQA